MGVALDTSALVTLERAGAALLESVPAAGEVFLPAIVVAELWIGVELSDSEERRANRLTKLHAVLRTAEVLPFDERVAPTYARLYAQLRQAGLSIPANDLAIAALAIHGGHELVVGPQDEERFRRVPGLTVRPLRAL